MLKEVLNGAVSDTTGDEQRYTVDNKKNNTWFLVIVKQ